jgi:hypothetical protein
MSEYILVETSGPRVIPRADLATHTLQVIDYAHHEVHSGSAYFALYSALKADTEIAEVRIQTPNNTKWAHMIIGVQAALATTVDFHEGTTMTHEAGNAIVPLNRNRNSTNTSGLTICHTPGGTDASGATFTEYIGAAATGGRIAVGGSAGGRNEFILDQNNDYLIRVTSRADGNAITILMDWYEHTDKS